LKTLSIIITFLFITGITQAQITTFERYYDTTYVNRAFDVATTFDGGFILTGFASQNCFFCEDIFLLKTDSVGDVQWVQVYDINGSSDVGNSVIQTLDSGYAVTGYTSTPPNLGANIYVMKIDKHGHIEWDNNFGGLGSDNSNDIIQTLDGGYAIAGNMDSLWAVIKLDSMGHEEWRKTMILGDGTGSNAHSIVQLADSGYVVAGGAYDYLSQTSAYDMLLVRLNQFGDTLWTALYGGVGVDFAYSLIVDIDSNIVCVGQTMDESNLYYDVYLVKTSLNGTLVWEKSFDNLQDPGASNFCYDIIENHNYYYLAGSSEIPFYGKASLLKVTKEGQLLWDNYFGGGGTEIFYSLCLAHDNAPVLAGLTTSINPGSMVYLVKTDTNSNVSSSPDGYISEKPFKVYPNPFSTEAIIEVPSSVRGKSFLWNCIVEPGNLLNIKKFIVINSR